MHGRDDVRARDRWSDRGADRALDPGGLLLDVLLPGDRRYVPNLVKDERQLGPANSAWASLDNLGFVVGPVLGGILVAFGGTTLAFVINALTFLVIAWILWGLPPSSECEAIDGGRGG